MNRTAVYRTLALAGITGMRAMAGPAALARARGGLLMQVLTPMAAGEMVADKTPYVGNRIDPLPLAGRAVLGAVVGGVVASEEGGSPLAGGLVGAAAAVAAAHLAFQVRKRLAGSSPVAGLIEDALVVAVAVRYGARSARARR